MQPDPHAARRHPHPHRRSLPYRPPHRQVRRTGALAALVALSALVAACGSSTTSTTSSDRAGGSSASTAVRATGPVDVLYAGSLVHIMETDVGPAFDRATGATFDGFAGGSTGLASEIRGGTQQADVFVSASPSVNTSLEGPANGSWVSWYATFATAPLVLGYNPSSRFAAALRTRPWYDVITSPGFLLGRTDPAVDPKGKLAVEALDTTAHDQHLPGLAALASSTSGVFPEEALVGRLQSGQLDAGFFYANEAVAAHIPTVPLTSLHLGATYTVTVVERAPHPAAADAFVQFLLGAQGRAILTRDGLTVTSPVAVTGAARVPPSLRAALGLG